MDRVTGFHLPVDLGLHLIHSDEVMYYLYLPVSEPGTALSKIPDKRLEFIKPLLNTIRDQDPRRYWESYVYATVKKMYVGGGVTANRPGWHMDGYLSDDLNYIWYDSVPTLFTSYVPLPLPADHHKSLKYLEMNDHVLMANKVVLPHRHLLKLDDRVIHKVQTDVPEQLMRTFVKITVSRNRFNLKDNSKNPLLPDDGPFFERALVRNDPHQGQRDHYQK